MAELQVFGMPRGMASEFKFGREHPVLDITKKKTKTKTKTSKKVTSDSGERGTRRQRGSIFCRILNFKTYGYGRYLGQGAKTPGPLRAPSWISSSWTLTE